jgi:M6 family metalloprotease-like protein
MRRRGFNRVLVVLVSLLIIPLNVLPSSGAEPISFTDCKIPQVDQDQVLRIGWPKAPNLIKPLGSPRFLVVGVDFRDAPMNAYEASRIEEVLQLKKVTERYDFVSNGKFSPKFEVFPQWVRMPFDSQNYGSSLNQIEVIQGEWNTHLLVHDLENLLDESISFLPYQGIIAFVSGGQALSGRAGYATVLDNDLDSVKYGINNYIVVGRDWENEPRVETWKVIVHEINHLIGIPDLYLYESDGYWQGKSPGPFGLQAFLFQSTSDSLGWNRWLNGWIPDSQVLCITNGQGLIGKVLSPPSDNNETDPQLVIFRLSNSQALVIESLSASGYDAQTLTTSLLVYVVDSSINTGYGPIRLVPRRTDLTTAPLSPDLPDWERYKEAPLIPNSYVEYQDFLIVNEGERGAGEVLSVYKGQSRIDKLVEISEAAKPKVGVEVTQEKSSTLKSIKCKKGKNTKVIRAIKPKCPKGYSKV